MKIHLDRGRYVGGKRRVEDKENGEKKQVDIIREGREIGKAEKDGREEK